MICIEFTTESGSTYYIDVVNQKLKRVIVKGEVQKEPEWYAYKELRGTGEIGKPMEIDWDGYQVSPTTPLVHLRFVQ